MCEAETRAKMSLVRMIFSNSVSSPSVKFTVSCKSVASPASVGVEKKGSERNEVRLGLPSKGRMATDTLDLLKVECSFISVNPFEFAFSRLCFFTFILYNVLC